MSSFLLSLQTGEQVSIASHTEHLLEEDVVAVPSFGGSISEHHFPLPVHMVPDANGATQHGFFIPKGSTVETWKKEASSPGVTFWECEAYPTKEEFQLEILPRWKAGVKARKEASQKRWEDEREAKKAKIKAASARLLELIPELTSIFGGIQVQFQDAYQDVVMKFSIDYNDKLFELTLSSPSKGRYGFWGPGGYLVIQGQRALLQIVKGLHQGQSWEDVMTVYCQRAFSAIVDQLDTSLPRESGFFWAFRQHGQADDPSLKVFPEVSYEQSGFRRSAEVILQNDGQYKVYLNSCSKDPRCREAGTLVSSKPCDVATRINAFLC